jgi:hypothetical protein
MQDQPVDDHRNVSFSSCVFSRPFCEMASLPLFESGQILSLKPYIINDQQEEVVDDEREIRVIIMGHKSNPDYELYFLGKPEEVKVGKRKEIQLCGPNGTITLGQENVWVILMGNKQTGGFGKHLVIEVPDGGPINIGSGIRVEPTALNKTPVDEKRYKFSPKINTGEEIEIREIHTQKDNQSFLDLTLFPNPAHHFYLARKNGSRKTNKH